MATFVLPHLERSTFEPAAGVLPALKDVPRQINERSLDAVLSLFGSIFGAFGFVWVCYERLLPFSGVLGFVLCWYVVFLGLYAIVTLLSHEGLLLRDRLATAAIAGGAGVVGIALLSTILFTVVRGWPALRHVNFYTHDMAGVRPQDSLGKGGVLHAIAGSAIELGIATGLALPLGIITGVYMTEVGGRLARLVRTVVEAMTSLPDLLAGLFVYTTLVIALGLERSGLAAAVALAVTMLPLVARSAEVALRVVPGGLREAGIALGSTQWRTVTRVVLPTAAPGLATALILALARGFGETAPVLITSGASTFMNADPTHNPMNSLPLFVYAALRSGQPQYIARGYGAATLLLFLVIVLFVGIRLIASRSVKTR